MVCAPAASETTLAAAENLLIARLPLTDRRRLTAACEVVRVELGSTLHQAGDPLLAAHFPIDAFFSLVAVVDGHPGLEVGMVGREGMVGVQLALGASHTPVRVLVQGSGRALSITAPALDMELARSAPLRRTLAAYVDGVMRELAVSAACMRFHLIGPRLARWLLMTRDRAGSDRFAITHEFLALMLGVRRAGVTGAADTLRARGLIAYRRGAMQIVDPAGLEAVACSCYRPPAREDNDPR